MIDEKIFIELMRIAEKSIVAQDRGSNQLVVLSDNIKSLISKIENIIKIDEKFARWLKVMSGIIAFSSVLVSAVVIIVNISR